MARITPRSPLARSSFWAWLLPIGAGLALVIGTRVPVARPPEATAGPSPSVAVPPTPRGEGRRLSEAIARAIDSTVALEYGDKDPSGRLRVATGVVINGQGEILSIRIDPPGPSDHPEIRARDAAGHIHPARWIAADAETGLTLLRIEADDIRPIAPAARDSVLGEEIFVVGTPYGLAHSVSRGHVAGLDRRAGIGPWALGGLIQIQAPIHPGDSGALLADLDGNWLGLVWGGLSPPAAPAKGPGPPLSAPAAPAVDDDFGFAIAAGDAHWVAGQLRSLGRVDRAYFGVRLAAEVATSTGPEPGAEVTEVLDHSPAARGGVLPKDRIIRLDRRPIRTPDDFTDRLDWTAADAEVRLEVARPSAHEPIALTVRTAARRPAVAIASASPPPAPVVRPELAPAPATGPLLERIERLERRIDDLERHDRPGATP